MGNTISPIQLKTLLLSVISELKFDSPLHPTVIKVKTRYKEMAGLAKNVSNKELLKAIGITYADNDKRDDYIRTIKKFKAQEFLTDN